MSVEALPLWKYGPVSSTLRSDGVLTEPATTTFAAPARAAADSGLPNGSEPATPPSSAVGRTPMLWKPASIEAVTPLRSVVVVTRPVPRAPKMALNVASENSAPEWQLAHFDWNVPKPSCWRCVRAVLSPSRKRSIGASSETSVDSYIWIARPQNSEKFASIIVNWLVLSGPAADT